MSNELCLKGLSLGQNFIRNDLIQVIAMAAARCERRTRTETRHRPSQHSSSDDRLPEERGEKRNHNNAKDKTPRVENRRGVVVGGQPVGIVHAKLLGRPPASQPHQTLIKIS
jgi:hypothetical protein